MIAMTVFPLLYGGVALLLGPDANWDLRNYHWYNAHACLHGRHGLDLLPSQVPFFYNPWLDVPFYLLASNWPAWLASFLLAAVQGLNFALLVLLAQLCLPLAAVMPRTLLAMAVAALGMFGAGGIAQIGTTFYDNVTSLGILGAALMICYWLPHLHRGSWRRALPLALVCGLPAGLVMGLKLPVAPFGVGLCAALFCCGGSWPRRWWLMISCGVGVILGLACTYGAWAWYLYGQYGNPFFPYFSGLFPSAMAPPENYRDIKFLPQGWRELLLYPFYFAGNPYKVGEIFWRDLRLPLLYLLLPLALLLRAWRWRQLAPDTSLRTTAAQRFLLWLAVFSYVTWLLLFAIYRYLLPLEMLAPLLLLLALLLLPAGRIFRGASAVAMALLLVITLHPGNWGRGASWPERLIDVRPPPSPGLEQAMVLMAGLEPYSHVLPAFPPTTPVIRIESNFIGPEGDSGMHRLIQQRLAAHSGRYLLLIPQKDLDWAASSLARFDFSITLSSCQAIHDNLSDSTVQLCDLQRNHRPAERHAALYHDRRTDSLLQ